MQDGGLSARRSPYLTVDSLKLMKKTAKVFGTICGILAAVCYGTNPLGALKLYAEGMATSSVLFYRFGLAWLIIALLMLVRAIPRKGKRRESLLVSRKEFGVLSSLGILFIFSSLTLYHGCLLPRKNQLGHHHLHPVILRGCGTSILG